MSSENKRIILRRYLLGQLSETEGSELAEKYFVDEELFDELLEVEEDLLDAYVRDRLSTEEKRSFAEYLERLPDGPGKLAAGYALMKAAEAEQDVSPAAIPTTARSVPAKSRTLREWFFGAGPLLQFATAAFLIGFAVGLVYLVVMQRHLRRDVESLTAERNRAHQEKVLQEQTAERKQAAQRDRIGQLERELEQARQQKQQQAAGQESETNGSFLASLVLTPALRSGGSPDVLRLAPGTKAVTLITPVSNQDRISSYRAVVQTTDGKLLFSQERLRPRSSGQSRTVTLRIPVTRLTGDSFKLTLLGTAADGLELAHDYYFQITRK